MLCLDVVHIRASIPKDVGAAPHNCPISCLGQVDKNALQAVLADAVIQNLQILHVLALLQNTERLTEAPRAGPTTCVFVAEAVPEEPAVTLSKFRG